MLPLPGCQVHTAEGLWVAVREATRNGTYLQFQPSEARVGRSQVSNRPELTAKLLLKQLQPQSNVRGKRTLFLVHLSSPRVQFLWTASRRTTALCSSIAKGCTFPVIEQDRINVPDQPFGGSQVIKFSPPPQGTHLPWWIPSNHYYTRRIQCGCAHLWRARRQFCGIYEKSGIELRLTGLYNRWLYSLSCFTSPSCQLFHFFTT